MRGAPVNSAFTLVELLVVIATTAVITGLLFPVLNKGKRNAQAAYDLNNYRQIIVAAQMYAGDNNDYLPQPGWGTSVACWAAGADVPPGNAPTFDRYTNAVLQQLASFREGQLYSWLKNERLLRCPADNVINAEVLERNIYLSSYVWNAAVIGFPKKSAVGAVSLTFKVSRFRPDAIIQWEADETRPYCFNDFCNYPDEGVSARHDNGPTIGRFDGAAERMPFSDFMAHSGAIASDFSHAGVGWKHCRVPTPNRLWCSPAHHGVPESSGG